MKKEKGFTIIEVLIVLAIAGLIVLVLFMALPTLKRNSRNNQRTADASKVAAAINECLTTNPYQYPSCDQTPATELPIDMSTLTQISSVVNWTVALGDPTELNAGNQVAVLNGHRCINDNSWVAVTMTPHQFIVFYTLESPNGPINRCMDV